MEYEIRFFANARGDEPVKAYLLDLPEKERAGVAALIKHLGVQGKLERPHGKRLTGQKGLYEITYKRHRVFYCYQGSQIILLNAFKKQSQATPKKELELGIKRMKML